MFVHPAAQILFVILDKTPTPLTPPWENPRHCGQRTEANNQKTNLGHPTCAKGNRWAPHLQEARTRCCDVVPKGLVVIFWSIICDTFLSVYLYFFFGSCWNAAFHSLPWWSFTVSVMRVASVSSGYPSAPWEPQATNLVVNVRDSIFSASIRPTNLKLRAFNQLDFSFSTEHAQPSDWDEETGVCSSSRKSYLSLCSSSSTDLKSNVLM